MTWSHLLLSEAATSLFLEGQAGMECKPKCPADGEDHQRPVEGEEKWAGGAMVS